MSIHDFFKFLKDQEGGLVLGGFAGCAAVMAAFTSKSDLIEFFVLGGAAGLLLFIGWMFLSTGWRDWPRLAWCFIRFPVWYPYQRFGRGLEARINEWFKR